MSPTRPMKPCAQPGCPALITDGARCDRHATERQRVQDAKRPSAAKRGYGRNWQKVRRMVLNRNPICTDCQRAAASEVHHKNGNSRDNREENLQALCKPCHSRTTAREHGRGRGTSHLYTPNRVDRPGGQICTKPKQRAGGVSDA